MDAHDDIRANWPAYKKKLIEKFPHLSVEELDLEIGREEELLTLLQRKLGKNWKEIRNMLSLMG